MLDFYEDSKGFKCFELVCDRETLIILSPQEQPYL